MKKVDWRKLKEHYPWRFMGFMLLIFSIPKLYDLTNVYWIGKISLEALAITEQFEFLSVSIEVVNETIPFGVLALVAQNWKNHEKVLKILKAGLVLQLCFSVIFMVLILSFMSQFVMTIGTPPEIVGITKMYLGLKALALPFEAVAFLLLICIKSMRRGKEALYLVTLSVILNMILDLFLISDQSFSLHMGIRGVALGYVISKIILAIVAFAYLAYILRIKIPTFIRKIEFRSLFKPILKIGKWTGADSLTRNLGYMGTLMVLNLIGINEFGGYGLSMLVMWTLIIPVLALAEGTNVVVGNFYGEKRYTDMRRAIYISIFLSFIIMLSIAFIGLFTWRGISDFFNPNPDMVNYSVQSYMWLMIPYICFGVGIIIKSLFFGTGETKYILFISLVANLCIIAPFVILVRTGFVAATYTNVMAQFFIVFVEDLMVTIYFANRLTKRITGVKLISIRNVTNAIRRYNES
ncbi:MATE family efflux transporter [Halobacteriota archaeon]